MSVSQFTANMQAMLPQWMKMAKDPNSVGAQFLNVFGLEFEDIKEYLDESIDNQYIETANIGQIDITYKVPIALPIVLDMEELDTVSVTKDDVQYQFPIADTIREFYSNSTENRAILDRDAGLVYLRPIDELIEGDLLLQPFDTVEINGTPHYEYSLHHIWNSFDEFGLLLGTERLFGERNEAFKTRILNVFQKPGNSTRQGLTNALSRELGIDESEVVVNEFANKAFRGSLLDDVNGTPTPKLINYVNRINKIFGFTWDNMSWGEAYWRSIEESQMGLEYLPHVWDSSTASWLDTDFQSGVGDGDELKVIAPKEESNTRNFKYNVGLRGRNDGLERVDPEISFKYRITAEGIILDEKYVGQVYQYTIVASEVVKLHYIIRAIKDYYYTTMINFDSTAPGYAYDNPASPSIEMIKGITNLSKTDSQYKYYKVIAEMSTRSVSDTPQLKDLTIKWRDTVGAMHDYILTSEADFTQDVVNTVDTNFVDTFATTDGTVELGFGDFYQMIDTKGSFNDKSSGAAYTNLVTVTEEGSVILNLPKE